MKRSRSFSPRAASQDYLAIPRTLGFKLIDHGRLVVQFVDYLEDVGAAVITTEQALAWLQLRTTASPFRQRRRLTRSPIDSRRFAVVIRQFPMAP